MRRPSSRSASNSGSRSIACRRLVWKPVLTMPSAVCSVASSSAPATLALKAWLVGCTAVSLPLSLPRGLGHGGRGGLCGRVREHLGDVADADGLAAPRQLTGHVEEAAEIAGEQRIGAGPRDIR